MRIVLELFENCGMWGRWGVGTLEGLNVGRLKVGMGFMTTQKPRRLPRGSFKRARARRRCRSLSAGWRAGYDVWAPSGRALNVAQFSVADSKSALHAFLRPVFLVAAEHASEALLQVSNVDAIAAQRLVDLTGNRLG